MFRIFHLHCLARSLHSSWQRFYMFLQNYKIHKHSALRKSLFWISTQPQANTKLMLVQNKRSTLLADPVELTTFKNFCQHAKLCVLSLVYDLLCNCLTRLSFSSCEVQNYFFWNKIFFHSKHFCSHWPLIYTDAVHFYFQINGLEAAAFLLRLIVFWLYYSNCSCMLFALSH